MAACVCRAVTPGRTQHALPQRGVWQGIGVLLPEASKLLHLQWAFLLWDASLVATFWFLGSVVSQFKLFPSVRRNCGASSVLDVHECPVVGSKPRNQAKSLLTHLRVAGIPRLVLPLSSPCPLLTSVYAATAALSSANSAL